MATQQDNIIQAKMTLTGGPPPLITVPEAALQTFVKGELLFMNGGYATEIASDTPSVIYGVAAEDAHNGATDGLYSVAVFVATSETVFEATMKQTGNANHVAVVSDLGITMALQRDTTNSKTFLNSSTKAGANVRVFVHTLGQYGIMGDTNVRALFTFLRNWVQFAGTS